MSVATLAEAKKLLTAEEFAKLPNPVDGSKQELVRGEVVQFPATSFRAGEVRGAIGTTLKAHLKQTKLGRVAFGPGIITEQQPDTVRGPDVAFWSYARLPADQTPVVYANVPADLVAEVVSPSNTRKQIVEKVREYFVSGVKLVWVVDPEEQTVTVYRAAGDGRVLWADATLTADDVLPGFTCPVSEFFQ